MTMRSIRIPLPQGKIGITVHGSPPMVTDIQPTSPMVGKLNIGDVIDGLSVPNKIKVQHVEEAHTLTKLLQKTSHLQRSLLILPDDYSSSSSSSSTDTPETEFHVTIPQGRLGITFEGERQPTIAKVWDYCPVKEFVDEGYWIKSILIQGEAEIVCSNLSARNVYEVLRSRAQREGRVMVLTNPPIAVAQPISSDNPSSGAPLYSTPTPRSAATTTTSTSQDLVSVNSGNSAPVSVSSSSTHNNTAQCSIDASIEGSVVTFQLGHRQGVRADHDNMVYMTNGFYVKKHSIRVREFERGHSLGMTEFIYEGSARTGTVAFAAGNKVVALKLEDYGGGIICPVGSYLCSERSAKVFIEKAPPSGEGCILLRLTGTGCVWLSGNNTILRKTMISGESLKCSTESIVAFEKSAHYFTHKVRGGLKSAISGKECFWTELTGPGCAWLQATGAECAATSSSSGRTNQPSSNGVVRPRQTMLQDSRAEI